MSSLRKFVSCMAVAMATVPVFGQLLPPPTVRANELPPTPPIFTPIPRNPGPVAPTQIPLAPSPAPQVNRPVPQILPTVRPQPQQLEALQFDSTTKEYTSQPGELTARLSFAVTNISKTDVTINWVRPSCGCTVAKLPQPVPWKLAPGEGGVMDFELDLRGKFGTLSKYVSVDTSHGQKLLNFRVTIPGNTALPGMDQRTQNMRLAMADRQAVFKGDCAKCHVQPGVGKMSEQLYAASCAICHDAPNRATMVPDLKALKFTPTKEYWQHWVENGKVGSLMPAFAEAHGGPLSKEQIDSLVGYLTHYFPPRASVAAATPSAED
jgi:cytochrome c553